ncbi:MAG: hypothetical protein OJJ21_11035 [Ferrovibrio sp.]|uniref:hypothetical protein n=1 Tax=Ferrovibrio sp. TaxID=1917215 RepID=UPI00261C2FFC|nr:hypothetical protein [Ferrovibrio sp.]MCW0234124.1 hypothetical protein [Ferrovibrio sp.]
MRQSAENARVRRETLRLLAQVEKQGLAIAEAYRSGHGVSAQFIDFKRFIEKVDHFYVFIDLVEERLPGFDDDKREALTRHLADIRWRIIVVEVDTTQIFLVRIGETHKPWPLGSREFLQRRLGRLGEIAAYYDSFGEQQQLTPLSDVMLRAVEELLKQQIDRAPALADFSDNAASYMAASKRTEDMTLRLDSGGRRRRRETRPPQRREPPPPFRVREMEGRFYAERDGIVAVSEVCRNANFSLDQLASRMGVSRPSLVLMLNGSDPMTRPMMEQLQSFLDKNGPA